MIRACAKEAYQLFLNMPKTPDPKDRLSGFRKAGVILTDITWAGEAQRELFVPLATEKSEALMTVMTLLIDAMATDRCF